LIDKHRSVLPCVGGVMIKAGAFPCAIGGKKEELGVA